MPRRRARSAERGDRRGAAVGRRGDRALGASTAGRGPATRSTSSATASRSLASAHDDVQLVAADLALELRASPRAITRPWSTTTMSSARRSASSRYWVVSRIVAPSPTRLSSTSQSSLRARGSRPVVGSSRNRTSGRGDERRGEVEPAAHAAGVLLARAASPASASANCSSSSSARSRARLRPRWCSSPIIVEVLAAGQQPVDRRVLGGEADAAAHRRRGRRARRGPATRADAGVRLGQRRQHAHRGGLAGAVGPSSAQTAPRGDSRSTPSSAVLLAVALDETGGLDSVQVGHRQQPRCSVSRPG